MLHLEDVLALNRDRAVYKLGVEALRPAVASVLSSDALAAFDMLTENSGLTLHDARARFGDTPVDELLDRGIVIVPEGRL